MATPVPLTEAISNMFSAIVTAITNVISGFAAWVAENAPLIASIIGIGVLVGLLTRYGRRIWEMIRGVLPF